MTEKKRGFTIIELVIVLVALAILAAIAIPSFVLVIQRSKASADTASVRSLNEVTAVYRNVHNILSDDTFAGIDSDEARMQVLVDDALLEKVPQPQQKDASFQWSVEGQVWQLFVAGEVVALTALGSTFTEISSAIIDLELELKASTGSFGRSWGDYAYTDIGLNSGDWTSAVDHIIYKPGGSRLMITPETGYTFLVEDLSGTEKELPASYNWNLVYDCIGGIWYYHSIAVGNEINIDTLQVVES